MKKNLFKNECITITNSWWESRITCNYTRKRSGGISDCSYIVSLKCDSNQPQNYRPYYTTMLGKKLNIEIIGLLSLDLQQFNQYVFLFLLSTSWILCSRTHFTGKVVDKSMGKGWRRWWTPRAWMHPLRLPPLPHMSVASPAVMLCPLPGSHN